MLTRPDQQGSTRTRTLLRTRRRLPYVAALSTAITVTACTNGATTGPVAVASSPSPPASSSAAASPAPSAAPPSPSPTAAAVKGTDGVQGLDVSGHQSSVDWTRWHSKGARFVFIKATEGTTYRNPKYPAQRKGARAAGYLQGAYHYARPANSSGAAQARFFAAAGGAWAADGATLPGALDLEAGDKETCHGLTPKQLTAWVRDFVTTYRNLTGRNAIIYVKAALWNKCTASNTSFGSTNPLWLYDHDGSMGPLPAGWSRPTLWQYGVVNGLDRNRYVGSPTELAAWATGP